MNDVCVEIGTWCLHNKKVQRDQIRLSIKKCALRQNQLLMRVVCTYVGKVKVLLNFLLLISITIFFSKGKKFDKMKL